MGLMAQIFGGNQGTQQPTNLIQSILSQRFKPDLQDTGDAAAQTFMTGKPVTPEEVVSNRLQPLMEAGKVIGGIQQNALELAKLNDMINFHQQSLAQNNNALPITTQPTTPQATGYGQNNPLPQPQGTSLPPVGSPQRADIASSIVANNGGFPVSQGTINSAPAGNAALAPLIDQSQSNQQSPQQPLSGNNTLPSGQPNSAPQSQLTSKNQPQQLPQENANLTPLFKGNGPYADDLEKGFQWGQYPNGTRRAMQIPGTIMKGSNGEILTSDAQGNVTQQIPPNPTAKAKLEQGLGKLADLYDQLHSVGGTVEEGGNILGKNGNLVNSFAGSSFTGPSWLGSPEIGGQDIARIAGTKAQTIRDEIHAISQQQVLPLMQAMGATPGMERAFQAQIALLESLGTKTTLERQAVLGTLREISEQNGNGSLASSLQPIKIITPDGQSGMIEQRHLSDLIASGGKLAQ